MHSLIRSLTVRISSGEIDLNNGPGEQCPSRTDAETRSGSELWKDVFLFCEEPIREISVHAPDGDVYIDEEGIEGDMSSHSQTIGPERGVCIRNESEAE